MACHAHQVCRTLCHTAFPAGFPARHRGRITSFPWVLPPPPSSPAGCPRLVVDSEPSAAGWFHPHPVSCKVLRNSASMSCAWWALFATMDKSPAKASNGKKVPSQFQPFISPTKFPQQATEQEIHHDRKHDRSGGAALGYVIPSSRQWARLLVFLGP